MRAPLYATLLLCACAGVPQGTEEISSFDALRLHEEEKILVLDVRSAGEILRGRPKAPLAQIQFGPDEWGTVSESDGRVFAERLRSLIDDRPIALLCLYGVRSAAAARALKQHGIAAQNITDGYLGNTHGPGWRAWE